MNNKKPIPVTIITGFLGAGKTTLLNEILQQNKSKKFLIIENEAGNINIDGSLIKGSSNNKLIELTSGCICCSLSTELGTLLNSFILGGAKFDYMIIEATGMADPGQLITMFTGKRVQQYYRLDSVVCMVDANAFLNRIDKFNEAYQQIAEADRIIINKCDLVPGEKIEEVESKVTAINPFAKVEKTNYGKLEGKKIINSELFQPSQLEKTIIDFSNLTVAQPPHKHSHNIQTLSLIIPGHFNMERISVWFEDFLMLNAKHILRIKGILRIEGMKHKIIIQSVGNEFHISQGSLWTNKENIESNIVFIGNKFNEKEIEESLCKQLVNSKQDDNKK